MGDPKDISKKNERLDNALASMRELNSWGLHNTFVVLGNGNYEILYANVSKAGKESNLDIGYDKVIASKYGLLFVSHTDRDISLSRNNVIRLVESLKNQSKKSVNIDSRMECTFTWGLETHDNFYHSKIDYYPHGLVGMRANDAVFDRDNTDIFVSVLRQQEMINSEQE